jgi:predicted esterase
MKRSVVGLYLLIIICGTMLGTLGYFAVFQGESIRLSWLRSERMHDQGTYLVYVPGGLDSGKKYPLVFALSPSADAESMIIKWQAVAEKHHWIIAASKESKNGVDVAILLRQIQAEFADVLQKYPAAPDRVIFTGLSGGGMASYAVTLAYPDQVWALVINTGMMFYGEGAPANLPKGKRAAMLASPADFRYREMNRDRAILAANGWDVNWIEFSEGHTLAPDSVYEQAAAWLDSKMDR